MFSRNVTQIGKIIKWVKKNINHRVILISASKVNSNIIPLILALQPNGFTSERKQYIHFNTE